MDTREQIMATLQRLKPEIQARYKVTQISVFGSTIRDEHTDSSDIDILVDFREDADLFDWTELALYLEDQTGRKIDLVPRKALRPELRQAVLAEAVAL